MTPFDNATAAPRGLVYLATFNTSQRAAIAASPQLQQAIRDSAPRAWPALVEQHLAVRREASASARAPMQRAFGTTELERQQRYVTAILLHELPALAAMQPGSGRNDAAFRLVCRVGRWAHHGIIPQDQLVAAVLDACERNGLVAEDGRKAVLDTISSGLAKSAADALPDLGARHG